MAKACPEGSLTGGGGLEKHVFVAVSALAQRLLVTAPSTTNFTGGEGGGSDRLGLGQKGDSLRMVKGLVRKKDSLYSGKIHSQQRGGLKVIR